MPSSTSFSKKPNWWMLSMWAILIAATWLFLWYGPWQGYLHAFIWFRLGNGLILFTIPGVCLYGLVVARSEIGFNHITFGFIISHLLFALFGTLGRFIHLSLETIKLLMSFTGLILALQFILLRRQMTTALAAGKFAANVKFVSLSHFKPRAFHGWQELCDFANRRQFNLGEVLPARLPREFVQRLHTRLHGSDDGHGAGKSILLRLAG